MERMTFLPLDVGKPVMKSNAICDQGHEGIDSSWNRPKGALGEDLLWLQTRQDEAYLATFLFKDGHQK